MAQLPWIFKSLPLWLVILVAGCQSDGSPTHTGEGAAVGGLLGAGTGALLSRGNPLAGAAIGAGVGALGGAVIGSQMDANEERNRRLIAEQMGGRQLRAGAVTIEDVVAMVKANVHEELIITQVRAHGMAAPLQPHDLIYLQQQGISPRIVDTMQACPPAQPQPQAVVVEQAAPPPVVVEGYYGPYYHRPHYYDRYYW